MTDIKREDCLTQYPDVLPESGLDQNLVRQAPIWILPAEARLPESALGELSELGLPKLALKLLCRRGYQDKKAIEEFLNPSLRHLSSPKLLPDMEKAVERILLARKKKEKVLVYGDYDVDGICGTALLVRVLKQIGLRVAFYIPHRELEGYGLSEAGIVFAKQNGFSLILTTDCGTTDFTAIEMAKNYGIDVIVCDHHEPKENLPNAWAVINPKRQDSDYPFRELAGVGVSFKLAWALLAATGQTPEDLVRYLDLVALGTVADVCPLVAENRVLVKFGMAKIRNTDKVGLRALLRTAGLLGKKITTYEIGFMLGPRINASGRIACAKKAVELLITEDENEAWTIAQELEAFNQRRQKIEDEILLSACQQIERRNLTKKRFLVLADETWHEGVVGIVAARLVERFYRPTILLALRKEKAKGSGRSIPGFHLFQALKTCKDYLLSYGGHKYAAGLVISRENIEQFAHSIDEYTKMTTTEDLFQRKIFVDAFASLYDLDETFLKTLAKFEPFGPENPEPVFLTTGLEVVGYPTVVGKEKDHLRFKVRQSEDRVVSAIAFGQGEAILKLVKGQKDHLDIVYYLDETNFAGKTRLQLNIKAMRIRNAAGIR
uniref:Single-stranded-DNA-specific exonuclease RecJ n=1 Tax=candidate division WOR-3 bacterium TaxID=2052148 RepID=A0A7C6A8N5_UNCW3